MKIIARESPETIIGRSTLPRPARLAAPASSKQHTRTTTTLGRYGIQRTCAVGVQRVPGATAGNVSVHVLAFLACPGSQRRGRKKLQCARHPSSGAARGLSARIEQIDANNPIQGHTDTHAFRVSFAFYIVRSHPHLNDARTMCKPQLRLSTPRALGFLIATFGLPTVALQGRAYHHQAVACGPVLHLFVDHLWRDLLALAFGTHRNQGHTNVSF